MILTMPCVGVKAGFPSIRKQTVALIFILVFLVFFDLGTAYRLALALMQGAIGIGQVSVMYFR